MARAWSGPEIEFLTRHLGESTKDIVGQFNGEFNHDRTYNSVQKKVKALRDAISNVQQQPEETVDDVLEELEEVIASEDLKIPHVTAAEKRAAREDAEVWLKEVVAFAHREISHISGVIASRAVRSDNASLVVALSDLHFGKHTDHFNLEVARQRIRSIPSELYSQTLPGIDEIVLAFMGDIVEGEDIYATQNGRVECPVFEQTQVAAQAIWEMILLFKELFGCPIRVEMVPGNHGRMSKTANEKSNWDNVVYHIVHIMSRMHNDPQIIVAPNFRQFHTFEIKNHRVGIYHEGVKHASTPAMREKIAGWVTAKELDLVMHGHWHEWHIGNWLGRIVVANGCLCGPDDLAEKMAREDNARQGWFLLEPNKPPYGFSFLEW